MPHGQPRLITKLPTAMVGMVLEKLISLITMALLAQYCAPDQLGAYLAILSVTALAALLGDLGTNRHLLRAASVSPAEAGEFLGEVISLRVPALTCALGLAIAGIWSWQPSLLATAVCLSVFTLGREIYHAFGAVMLALGDVRGRVSSGLAGPAWLLVVVLLGTRRGFAFDELMLLHATAGIVMLLSGWLFARRHVRRFPLGIERERTRALVCASLPLFALALLEVALARSGEILLAARGDLTSVAEYGLGYRIVEASRFLIRPSTMVLFPLLAAAAARSDWDDYHRHLRALVILAASIGVGLGLALGLRPDLVMPALFGDAYVAAGSVLQIFALTVPLLCLLTAETLLLVSLNLERLATQAMALVLVLHVLISVATIPRFGAHAAAWSIAAAHLALCLIFGVLLHRDLRHRRIRASAQQCMVLP